MVVRCRQVPRKQYVIRVDCVEFRPRWVGGEAAERGTLGRVLEDSGLLACRYVPLVDGSKQQQQQWTMIRSAFADELDPFSVH